MSTSFSGGPGTPEVPDPGPRLGDREVRVPGPTLRRGRPEELGVEVDRGVEIADVECELDPCHRGPPCVPVPLGSTSYIDHRRWIDHREHIDRCQCVARGCRW